MFTHPPAYSTNRQDSCAKHCARSGECIDEKNNLEGARMPTGKSQKQTAMFLWVVHGLIGKSGASKQEGGSGNASG